MAFIAALDQDGTNRFLEEFDIRGFVCRRELREKKSAEQDGDDNPTENHRRGHEAGSPGERALSLTRRLPKKLLRLKVSRGQFLVAPSFRLKFFVTELPQQERPHVGL